jgi:hypothetical protein
MEFKKKDFKEMASFSCMPKCMLPHQSHLTYGARSTLAPFQQAMALARRRWFATLPGAYIYANRHLNSDAVLRTNTTVYLVEDHQR